MALINCEFFSEALGVCSSMNLILPQKSSSGQIGIKEAGNDQSPPILYLLHGYSDNHTIWMRRTSLERYVSEAGLAVVMPTVNLSYYANMKTGERYWDFVSHELPEIVQSFFRISNEPEKTYVAGLSMGGYGAFKLALTYPERYAAAGSFSGALDIHTIYKFAEPFKMLNLDNIFGGEDKLDNSENDLFYLAGKLAKKRMKNTKLHIPTFYQCCGTADFLYKANLKFRDLMLSRKFDLTYEEEPGADHNWAYWDNSIERFISFIRKGKRAK